MAKSLTFKASSLKMYPEMTPALAHLFETRYGNEPICPKCGQVGTFHKLNEASGLHLQLRPSHSPDGWHALRVDADAAADVVPDDVPVLRDPATA